MWWKMREHKCGKQTKLGSFLLFVFSLGRMNQPRKERWCVARRSNFVRWLGEDKRAWKRGFLARWRLWDFKGNLHFLLRYKWSYYISCGWLRLYNCNREQANESRLPITMFPMSLIPCQRHHVLVASIASICEYEIYAPPPCHHLYQYHQYGILCWFVLPF